MFESRCVAGSAAAPSPTVVLPPRNDVPARRRGSPTCRDVPIHLDTSYPYRAPTAAARIRSRPPPTRCNQVGQYRRTRDQRLALPPEDLSAGVRHDYRPTPRDAVLPRVDRRQTGVGGDDSRGAHTHDELEFSADRDYAYTYRLRPLADVKEATAAARRPTATA